MTDNKFKLSQDFKNFYLCSKKYGFYIILLIFIYGIIESINYNIYFYYIKLGVLLTLSILIFRVIIILIESIKEFKYNIYIFSFFIFTLIMLSFSIIFAIIDKIYFSFNNNTYILYYNENIITIILENIKILFGLKHDISINENLNLIKIYIFWFLQFSMFSKYSSMINLLDNNNNK